MDIATSADRQTVTLSTGEAISARLVVVANGLNVGLRHKLGMARDDDLSKTHSIMLGFDLVPAGRASFPFPALTYYGERPADRTAYITLFPIGADDAREPLRLSRDGRSVAASEFRDAPRETLAGADAGARRRSPAPSRCRARCRSARPISM